MGEKFGRLTPGYLNGPQPALQDVPQLGRVTGRSEEGVSVVLDSMPGITYGPAPWGLGVYSTAALAITAGYAPRVGDRVLLVFAGVGVEAPVVAAWWR